MACKSMFRMYILPSVNTDIKTAMLSWYSCFVLSREPSCGRGRKKGNVLFNDTLNTFYLRLYGVRHMVKDHSNSERGNPLPPHGLLFSINSKDLLYALSHRQDSTYYGLCYTSRGPRTGTRNSSMGPPHEGSIRRPIAPWANALTTELHLAPVWAIFRNVVFLSSRNISLTLQGDLDTDSEVQKHHSCRIKTTCCMIGFQVQTVLI